MKKLIYTFILSSILLSCDQKNTEVLHLTGNIKGLKTGTLYIQKANDSIFTVIDSIKITGNSNFETTLNIKSPEMLYLFLNRGVSNSLDNNIAFFAEPGNMHIETRLDSYIASATITGSKNHDLYEEYKKVKTNFNDKDLTFIEQKFNAFKANNMALVNEINTKQDQNLKRKYLYATNFAINNKNFEVAPYIALSDIYDINIKFLDTIQKSMSAKVAKSLYGKKLTAYYNERKKQVQ
jgi:Domain of unknown function (DUF4369)